MSSLLDLDDYGCFAPLKNVPLGFSPELFNTYPLGNGLPQTCQGSDPILGPPYAPIDFQLFIDQPPSVSDPVHLRWTIPSLALQWSASSNPLESPRKYRVWFSTTSSPVPNQYVHLVTNGAKVHIYTSSYVWAQLITDITDAVVTPVGAGTAVPGGTSFSGAVVVAGAGASISFVAAGSPVTIDHFTLVRGDGGPGGFPDHISDSINGAGPYQFDDSVPRGATSNYFWKLTGIASNGLVFVYNIVSLIRQYSFTATRGTDAGGHPVVNLSWDSPSAADMATWPGP